MVYFDVKSALILPLAEAPLIKVLLEFESKLLLERVFEKYFDINIIVSLMFNFRNSKKAIKFLFS